jgi:hypothetical protein
MFALLAPVSPAFGFAFCVWFCVSIYIYIYISDHRKDGARVTTRIRRVSGDRDLFLNELRATLQIPIPKNPREDTIRIRTGGTIEIKGNRVLEVKTWLAGLGF